MEPVLEVSGENDSLLEAQPSRTKSVNSVNSEVYHSASSKVTSAALTATGPAMSSGSGAWDSPLKEERKSGFVTFNPISLFLACRNAKILTIEPVIFLYMFGTYLFFPLYQQYFFLQFAKQVIGNSSILPNGTYCLTSNQTNEYGNELNITNASNQVEQLSNNMNLYISLANQVPSIIFTLIYGPLSDRIGRRPILVIVACGAVLQGLFALAVVHWELSVYYFILGAAIGGIGGDFASVLMASFSYLSDVSSAKWLTFRIGVAEAMLFMAGALAEGAGGIWFEKLNCNFLPPVGLFVGCNALLIAYVLLLLPESLSRKERERRALDKPKGVANLIRGFKIYLCQVAEYPVWKLWASVIALFVLVMTSAGSQRIAVFFLKSGEPFDWDPGTIGFYQMTAQLSHMVGLLVVLPILVALKLPDALISLIGLAFNAGMNVFIGLTKQTFEMFIVAVIQGVEAILFPPLRSIQSKAVDKSDQGALFSILASVEVGATLASGLTFPFIIPAALKHGISPGVAYVIMAGLCVVPLSMLLLLFFFRKRSNLCQREPKKLLKHAPPPPAVINDPDYSSVSEQDSLLPPGYRGTYPYTETRPVNRSKVRSMI